MTKYDKIFAKIASYLCAICSSILRLIGIPFTAISRAIEAMTEYLDKESAHYIYDFQVDE